MHALPRGIRLEIGPYTWNLAFCLLGTHVVEYPFCAVNMKLTLVYLYLHTATLLIESRSFSAAQKAIKDPWKNGP